ncbi:LPS export ABC transporter permease LptG [Tsuneonella flava]|uniref:LPS export ABC transporter permease LptG n=1 Tax=Tsuneonella flava TaxID=2055955 RepID=A0ABX7KA22_9SPHN|nr:LPS export ABC transporter permease LptG [Tsuneonella flava]QSB44367.1 LPS export ABC transporter permease LptG [Tsuneonella flava]
MQLDFFPSRTLTGYLAKMFIVRIIAVLVMLVMVLLMLDLLSNSGKVLAAPGNGQAEVLTYVSLRAPQLIARFLPYSVLLASILTLATLNQNSEVIAMKAAGLSAHQVLAPLLLTALATSGLSFAFNERVLTRANATLSAWQANDYAKMPTASGAKANVYVTDGTNILYAANASGTGAAMRLEGVTYYQRAPSGAIATETRAASATYASPGWKLTDATRFEVATAETTRQPSVVLGQDLTPEQIELGSVNPDGQSLMELSRSIADYREAGRRTAELEAKWWHKISGPLSAALMPLLGAVAAFGLARSGQLFLRAIIGMALGFAYFVVDNAALAMGNFGGYPPFLAAWAPFMLFLLIGETVLIRTEE